MKPDSGLRAAEGEARQLRLLAGSLDIWEGQGEERLRLLQVLPGSVLDLRPTFLPTGDPKQLTLASSSPFYPHGSY